jgi:hypothetical protein
MTPKAPSTCLIVYCPLFVIGARDREPLDATRWF